MSDAFEILTPELTEEILKHLAIPDLVRASLACRLFRKLILSPRFPCAAAPWFFLCGLHNISSRNHQTFAFDPSSFSWFRLPSPPTALDDVSVSDGFYFSTTHSSSFSFSPIFRPRWRSTSPLNFPRRNPLPTFISDSSIIVLAGARFVGGLVDIEDRLAVEIYDRDSRSWSLFPPLPIDFPFGYSSQTLASALHRDKLFVYGVYSFSISWFDQTARNWGPVLTLRPPRAIFSFLISCGDILILASMCTTPHRFVLWRLNEQTMELKEIAALPAEMADFLVDSEQDDNKFASLKCVGTGGLVYVFNEDHYQSYAACLYDIASNIWRKVPPLPSPVNKFHKVLSFCSAVSPGDIIDDRRSAIFSEFP